MGRMLGAGRGLWGQSLARSARLRTAKGFLVASDALSDAVHLVELTQTLVSSGGSPP